MDKDFEKLYKYCKSQGYSKSQKEFEKELEDLALEQLGSEELSGVAGGSKKTTTAFAASLVSALSIASPFASAKQITLKSMLPDTTMIKDTVNSQIGKITKHFDKDTLNSYKEKLKRGISRGVKYAKDNEKTIKDILLKGVLPVGIPVSAVVVGGLILNHNKQSAVNNKLCKLFAQLIRLSYEYCVRDISQSLKKINATNLKMRLSQNNNNAKGYTFNGTTLKIYSNIGAFNVYKAIVGAKNASSDDDTKEYIQNVNYDKDTIITKFKELENSIKNGDIREKENNNTRFSAETIGSVTKKYFVNGENNENLVNKMPLTKKLEPSVNVPVLEVIINMINISENQWILDELSQNDDVNESMKKLENAVNELLTPNSK